MGNRTLLILACCVAGIGADRPVHRAAAELQKSDEALPVPRSMAPRPDTGQPAGGVALDDLVLMGLERDPRLAQAAIFINEARGQAIQAGLYPNPTFNSTYDELGDRTGPGGINSQVLNQEIVTAHKLRLSRNAATRGTDQATLQFTAERYLRTWELDVRGGDKYKALIRDLDGKTVIVEGLAPLYQLETYSPMGGHHPAASLSWRVERKLTVLTLKAAENSPQSPHMPK